MSNGGIESGLGGNRVSLIAGQLRLHGVHVSSRLDIFKLRQHLAFFYLVTFLHIEMGDAAHGIGANVDVSFGPDLARGGDHRGYILLHHFAGLHRDHIFLRLVDGEADDSAK